ALFEQSVDSVVMGRPVFFSTDAQKDALAQSRLHTAASSAGFQHIQFLFEPIGAALTYEANFLAEEVVFVFDFGGGTLDFSVIRIGPQRRNQTQRREDILAVGGVVIGGNTFDEDVMEKRLIKY